MNKIQELFDYVLQQLKTGKLQVGKVNIQDRFMQCYMEMVDLGVLDVNSWKYKAMAYQAIGGDCPVCGKRWHEKKCMPIFTHGKRKGEVVAEYHYYVPSCNCIPYCPGCGNLLLEEFYNKSTVCGNCETSIRCTEWSDETVGNGKERFKVKKRCEGHYRPMVGHFICDTCGEEKIIRRRNEAIS